MEDIEKMEEEMEQKNEAMQMLLDMLAEVTKNPRTIAMKKQHKFESKMHKILTDKNITDEQFNQINGLLDQFEKLIDEVLKEE